jgi:Amt family ammonium transporter
VGGALGALLTGVFAVKSISGAEGSLATQALGVGVTVVYCAVVTFILLKLVDLVMGLRVTEEQEREGLDLALHGERVD